MDKNNTQTEISNISSNSDFFNSPDESEIQNAQILIFKLQSEFFGLEIKYIQRIETSGEITPIPRTPEFILGIINLRGNIVTLIDFARYMSKNTKSVKNGSHIVILQNELMNLGLIVEMIFDVIYIPIDDLQEDEDLPATFEKSYIKRVVRLQDKVVNIVNAEKIFKEITKLEFTQDENIS